MPGESFVSANGLTLAYESQGEGEPVLLVMGIGAQLIHWPDAFCAQLAARGFRVIRFDNRDVGLSSKIEGQRVPPVPQLLFNTLLGLAVPSAYTLLDMADDAAGLLDALELPSAHVVGVSMGGMIAQTLAIAHPHRVKSLVSIMSHPGERRFHLTAHPRAVRALLQPVPRSRDEAMRRAETFFRTVAGPRFPPDVALVREQAARAYDRAFYPAGVMRQMAAILASPPRTGALRYVRVPTTVVHGSADPLIRPAGGEATARAVPGARLEIIEGLGHDLPEGAWPRILDAIERTARGPAGPR